MIHHYKDPYIKHPLFATFMFFFRGFTPGVKVRFGFSMEEEIWSGLVTVALGV